MIFTINHAPLICAIILLKQKKVARTIYKIIINKYKINFIQNQSMDLEHDISFGSPPVSIPLYLCSMYLLGIKIIYLSIYLPEKQCRYLLDI